MISDLYESRHAPPTLYLLLSSTFVFLRSPFLATVQYAWNRLVHSEPESFFNADVRDL